MEKINLRVEYVKVTTPGAGVITVEWTEEFLTPSLHRNRDYELVSDMKTRRVEVKTHLRPFEEGYDEAVSRLPEETRGEVEATRDLLVREDIAFRAARAREAAAKEATKVAGPFQAECRDRGGSYFKFLSGPKDGRFENWVLEEGGNDPLLGGQVRGVMTMGLRFQVIGEMREDGSTRWVLPLTEVTRLLGGESGEIDN